MRYTQNIKLQLWDTAGKESFKNIIQSYYKIAAGIILVYDISDIKSFNDIPLWLNDVRELVDKETIIILVGNKCDLEKKREVSFEKGLKFAQNNDILFFETSSKNNKNINQIFFKLATQILNKIYDKEQNTQILKNGVRYIPENIQNNNISYEHRPITCSKKLIFQHN